MGLGIILCGASSVGAKTTLASDWVQRSRHAGKDFSHIQKVARDVMKQHSKFTREGLKESLKTADKVDFVMLQRLIIEEQNRRELRILEDDPNCSYISDRGPDPLAFAHYYVSRAAADQLGANPATKECLQRYKKCLVVVLCPLETATEDGVRLTLASEGVRDFTRLLRGLLDEHEVPYIYIDEIDRQERVRILEQAVKHFKWP